jgi:uridine kinase
VQSVFKKSYLSTTKLTSMFVIGIAGGTGSGKTTVVKKIRNQLQKDQVSFLAQDSYYKDNSHLPLKKRQDINFDHPDSIEFELLTEHIRLLKQGRGVDQPTYSYLTCTREEKVIPIEPRQVIIVEGILIYTHKPLVDLIDIKVFVDADADDRLSRVIHRDTSERGRTTKVVLERYEKTVKPMHLQFIEPSKRYADIIVPQGGMNDVAISILLNTIEKKLSR